tara:strand:+ start:18782 stop:19768 length:987 start_codon:yes stop_codon:yes gene_type:complete
MSKKVLITGGAGFIGIHLVNKLLDEGFSVDIVDNFSRGKDDNALKKTLKLNRGRLLFIDLLNIDAVQKLDKDYDFIFHLAAIIGVAHVMKKPFNVLNDNIQMLVNVIDLAKKQTNLSRLFFSSTSEVYSGTMNYFDLAIPTPETAPLTVSDLSLPRSSYMLSKIYGEALCHQSQIPFTLFRPHNIYGPRMGMAHIIPEQLKKSYFAKNGEYIPVYSTNHTRSFCYIDDAIELIWCMINNQECEGKTLNLGSQSQEITIKEVVKICFETVGKNLKIDSLPAQEGSPLRRAPDMELTTKLTNYESQIDLKEGIALTYKWYRKNVFEKEIN